jgi:ATP-binding cassette subfamily B (MDR/TAP) protein 1
MQATSNGKLIQSGTAEKLGIVIQAIATFIAAFIIAFISQWKLTLILICLVPALLLIVGSASVPDAKIETRILKIQAQAGSYAESIFGGIRTVHAFSLRSRVVARLDGYLQDVIQIGKKKNLLYGAMFGGEFFVMYAGMGLAFWQGIAMVARGEVPDVGKVFTYVPLFPSSPLSRTPASKTMGC